MVDAAHPNVARLQVVDERLTSFVDGCDTDGTIEDQTPFVGLVPVELSIGMRLEAHVNSSHLGCNGEDSRVLLTSPTSIVLTKLVVRQSG